MQKKIHPPTHSKWPLVSEMDEALHFWTRSVQEKHFSNETGEITDKSTVYKGKLRNLQPFVAPDGLLRVGGRLSNAKLPEEEMHPVILPQNDKYVERYILALHEALGHPGPETTLANLLTKHWVLMGQMEVKRCLHHGTQCYRLQARPFKQLVVPLPARQVDLTFAFVHVGLDFCGPMTVLVEAVDPRNRSAIVSKK